MPDSLGDRMKQFYENSYRVYLTRRTPVIIRLDGKAFHTFTKKFQKPFDLDLCSAMDQTGYYLLNEIQGAKAVYVQSDEISLLLTDYDRFETDAWFGNNLQKMCSISASMTTSFFQKELNFQSFNSHEYPIFDSRVFNIPREEVLNYFRWRYQDWLRNSIQMLAQSLYSHKELHGKNKSDLHEMCFQKGHNWNDLNPRYKNGFFAYKERNLDLIKVCTFTDFNLMDPSYLALFNELVS